MKKLVSSIMALVLLLTFTLSLTVSAASATAIKFEKTSDMNAEVGKTYKRTAITTPEGIEVTYTSNNPKIATVDKEGRVKAIAGGMTVITATSDKVKASYNVNVKKSSDTDITPDTATNPITPELQKKIDAVKKMYPKAHFSQVGDNKDGTRGEKCVVPFFRKRDYLPFEFLSHDIDKLLSGENTFNQDGLMYVTVFRGGIVFETSWVYDTYTYDWVKKHQTKYFYMNKDGTFINLIHPPKEALSWLNEIHNYWGDSRAKGYDTISRNNVSKDTTKSEKWITVDTHFDPNYDRIYSPRKTEYNCHICGKKLETPKKPW